MLSFNRNCFIERDIDLSEKINCTDVVHAFLREYHLYGHPNSGTTKKHLRVTTKDEALDLLDHLNTPGTRSYQSLDSIQGVRDVWQQFECIKSNLRGYVYYFECSGCEKLTKYIYKPLHTTKWRCRDCYGLIYKRKPGEIKDKDKKHKPYQPRIKTTPKPDFWGTGR
jgi:hypothetical protein